MKVILAGDNTPEHFYPLLAVAEELRYLIDKENLADIGVYLFSPEEYSKKDIYENGLIFKRTIVGRSRFSLATLIGSVQAILTVFSIFPDVIVIKGGVASYPMALAAKIFKIPLIIHESNSIPDKVNLWASKFAFKVTVSFKQAAEYFDRNDVIHVGQPIRNDLKIPNQEGGHQFLKLETTTPILWIAPGAKSVPIINNIIEEALPRLLNKYQVIHELGKEELDQFKSLTEALLEGHPFKYRYRPVSRLNKLSMKMIGSITDIAILRSGVNLFETARWGIPGIIIPDPESDLNNDIKNAYNYARAGAATVIEENNLDDRLLGFEIDRIYDNEDIRTEMSRSAKEFSVNDAGENLAEEIVAIALTHEKQG